MTKRRYTKSARAEQEEETRRRITEAAVDLHGTVGPARTSISAVAERAGVQRATVYRHFPDEAALFDACSAHWNARNPPPDPAQWIPIEDPEERTRTALRSLYAFYDRTEAMLANLLRDESASAVVRERFQAYHLYLETVREQLLQCPAARAPVGHALAFTTWRSLVREQALTGEQAAELMTTLIMAVCGSQPRPTTRFARQ